MMKSFHIGNLEVKLPIIQGGMGVGVSMSGLASAVATQGGVGVISCAGLGLLYKQKSSSFLKDSIHGLQEELRKARKLTDGIIGVNIMSAMTNFADMVRTSIAEKADVIFAGAGLPLDLPSYLKSDSRTKLVPIVSSARAAKILCQKWLSNYNYLPDALVVEGPKAGGHLGFKRDQLTDEHFSLEELVPEVVKVADEYKSQKSIPVIAAGGISSGEDMYKMLGLGAQAVQMGSMFVPTNECDASDRFKQVYIDAKQEDTMIIQSPVGMPGRAIHGDFIDQVEQGKEVPKSCPYHCIKSCNFKKSPYCIMNALFNAAKGNLNKGYVFAGANAFLADKISSVKDVINKIRNEFFTAENKA